MTDEKFRFDTLAMLVQLRVSICQGLVLCVAVQLHILVGKLFLHSHELFLDIGHFSIRAELLVAHLLSLSLCCLQLLALFQEWYILFRLSSWLTEVLQSGFQTELVL